MPERQSEAIRILLIEDDEDDYLLTREFLRDIESVRFDIEWRDSYEEGLVSLLSGGHQVCLVDYRLGERTGIDLLKEATRAHVQAPMIFLTAQKDLEIDRLAMEAGASDYLVKGAIDPALLERSIRYALQRRRTEEVLAKARQWELEVGSRIQQTLLFRPPPTDLIGAAIGAVSMASQNIDGDYWDFFNYDRRRFDVIVGDVMGKGVPAALLGAATKSHFQRAVRQLIVSLREFGRLPDPEEIVGAVHSVMTPELISLDSFVTLCYARFDLEAMQLLFTDAGHTRTVHYSRARAECTMLAGSNLPLGFSEDELYSQTSIDLEPGDIFVFYSDGVTEAQRSDGEFFGTERLVDLVTECCERSAEDIATTITKVVREYSGGGPLRDDLTCLVVKVSLEVGATCGARATMEVHSVPAELEAMRQFVRWVSTKAASPPLSEEATDRYVLAVSEAATNILNHAYWGARDRRLQVTAETYPDHVRVELCDWGRSFKPEDVRLPDFDGSRDGGFGVYIIGECVDQFKYYRDDLGRNCLRLIMRTAGGPEERTAWN